MKKKLSVSLLAVGLVFGTIQTASAKAFGTETTVGECFAGVQPVFKTFYLLYIPVNETTTYQAC